MNQEKIGAFIREIRKGNHLTQEEFANKYGVTYQAVSNWEHGKNLPDISLLKEISKDFNVSLDELLEGSKSVKNEEKKMSTKHIIIGLVIFFIIIISFLIIVVSKNNNFEFKTLSSNCDNFTISGSISYNNNKTAIYIDNVNYCGIADETMYQNIECLLYEKNKASEILISKNSYEEDNPIKLEEFLKSINFTVDDYSRNCQTLSNGSLYLQINATEENGKTTSYKIPLSLTDTCKN